MIAADQDVLNPSLFQRLQLFFGEVEVASRGKSIQWELRYEHDYSRSDGHRVPRRHVLFSGEEYRVRCRLCRDYRARLHISHQWGVLDEPTGSRNLWLAHCFNEDCFHDYDARRQLYEQVWNVSLTQLRRSAGQTARDVRRGTVVEQERTAIHAVPSPGPCMRLDELARSYPNHEALRYLDGRGFDPVHLGRYWKVSYCVQSHYYWAGNRIIIPIYQQGMQVGWQARYIGDNVNGEPFNVAKVPKYWTSPSMPRRLVAYNIEQALQYPTLIIVEGPSDVWRVGAMATATLGTSMSQHVMEMIANGMRCHGDKGVVVVALDPEQPRRQNPRPAPHPIAKLTERLSALLPGRVVPLFLPDGYDPGSIDRRQFFDLAHAAVSERGLTADFTVRAKPPAIPAAMPGPAEAH